MANKKTAFDRIQEEVKRGRRVYISDLDDGLQNLAGHRRGFTIRMSTTKGGKGFVMDVNIAYDDLMAAHFPEDLVYHEVDRIAKELDRAEGKP